MTGDSRRYCTFYLGGECYGIDILAVREIDRHLAITSARGAAPSVRGLANLRGQIVTVIDPALRLGYPVREIDRSTRVIILKTNADMSHLGDDSLETSDEIAGLCVDRISDIISVPVEAHEPPPRDEAAAGDGLISSVVQLEDQVVRIVSPRQMLLAQGAR
jgi:purine-binding chemotaxis protein CheW